MAGHADRIRDQVIALLERAVVAPDELHELGQQAALLWWSLDDHAALDGPPGVVEAALLDLATWHVRDERLGRQRGSLESLSRALVTLRGTDGDAGPSPTHPG